MFGFYETSSSLYDYNWKDYLTPDQRDAINKAQWEEEERSRARDKYKEVRNQSIDVLYAAIRADKQDRGFKAIISYISTPVDLLHISDEQFSMLRAKYVNDDYQLAFTHFFKKRQKLKTSFDKIFNAAIAGYENAFNRFDCTLKKTFAATSPSFELANSATQYLVPALQEAYTAAVREKKPEQIQTLAKIATQTRLGIESPNNPKLLCDYQQLIQEARGVTTHKDKLIAAMRIMAGILMLGSAIAIISLSIQFLPVGVIFTAPFTVPLIAGGIGQIYNGVATLKEKAQKVTAGKSPASVITACSLFQEARRSLVPKPDACASKRLSFF